MINYIILKKKKIKSNDVAFPKNSYDKNVYRSMYFYNKTKYKHKKWKFLRSWRNIVVSVIMKRFSPLLKYMPKYSRLVIKPVDVDNIRINKVRQYLTYDSKLSLLKRFRSFFRFRTVKKTKKKFIYKHITTQFNHLDTNFEILLLRLGIVDNMKTARVYINHGILKINKHIRYKTRHLINFDRIKMSRNLIPLIKNMSVFLRRRRRYKVIIFNIYLKTIDHIELLCTEAREFKKQHFLGTLPFTFTINYKTMTFVYFNIIFKNQWNYFFDFFSIKKFLQYAR